MYTMKTTFLNLSLVVVLNNTWTTKSWIEYPIIREAAKSIYLGPVGGRVLGEWGAVACAHVKNPRYPTMLSIPIANNLSPKLKYLITTVKTIRIANAARPIH